MQHNKQIESYINLVVSLLITIVNKILQFGIVYLTEKEKMMTHTEFQITIAKRLSNAQFVNTSIVILIVEIFISNRHLYDFNGIGQNIISIAFSVAITTSLLNFLDFEYLMARFKRKEVIKSYMKSRAKKQTNEAVGHAFKINENSDHHQDKSNVDQQEIKNLVVQKQSSLSLTYKDDDILI